MPLQDPAAILRILIGMPQAVNRRRRDVSWFSSQATTTGATDISSRERPVARRSRIFGEPPFSSVFGARRTYGQSHRLFYLGCASGQARRYRTPLFATSLAAQSCLARGRSPRTPRLNVRHTMIHCYETAVWMLVDIVGNFRGIVMHASGA